jgi:hypothetical protein
MKRIPAIFRLISLPGVLAAAAVALVLILFSVAPCPATEAGTPSTSPTGPSVARRHESPPASAALRQNHATNQAVGSRHAGPGVLLVPRPGTGGVELPARLALFRGRLPAPAHPLLHVLFCTWLA